MLTVFSVELKKKPNNCNSTDSAALCLLAQQRLDKRRNQYILMRLMYIPICCEQKCAIRKGIQIILKRLRADVASNNALRLPSCQMLMNSGTPWSDGLPPVVQRGNFAEKRNIALITHRVLGDASNPCADLLIGLPLLRQPSLFRPPAQQRVACAPNPSGI